MSIDNTKVLYKKSDTSNVQNALSASKTILSNDAIAPKFLNIECQDDVITHFFNQIVQLVIDDMVLVTAETEQHEVTVSQSVVKDFKELNPGDLSKATITSVEGSKVTLTKDNASNKVEEKSFGKKNKTSALSSKSKSVERSTASFSRVRYSQQLEVIDEEGSKQTISTLDVPDSTTSLLDLDMEKEYNVKITFVNGNVYKGQIVKRIMNGHGTYLWDDGTVYEGEFKDGFPTGKGVMTLPDLSHFEGNFNQGLFHDYGFLNIVSTPTFYSGQWKNGMRHGEGWLLYEAYDWYEGGWKDDLKDGFGIRHYKCGAKYRGHWKRGKYEGEGIMIWENCDFYKGEWLQGLMDGQGEYIWKAFYNKNFAFPVNTFYRGSWKKGKRSGPGVMYFGSDAGVRLEGLWEYNCKHGDGRLICSNGKVVEQRMLFYNDKPIEKESSDTFIPEGFTYKIFELPVFAAPELVDVGFYIDQILDKIQSDDVEKLKTVKIYEEYCVKNTILKYLPQLNDLYQTYANQAVEAQLHYQPVLIRLCLWQLYKDVEISKFELSLIDIDLILGNNPNSCLDTLHYPFEPIYFWQFLMSLIGVALATTSLDDLCDDTPEGVSACILRKFFDNVIFAKSLEECNSLMLSYLNVAPIKALYKLYKELGEPHSVRTFLKHTCWRKDEQPELCYFDLKFKSLISEEGINIVPLLDNIDFENDSVVEFLDNIEYNKTKLFQFWRLGPVNIVRCIAQICPLIKFDNMIVNIDYPLTFLEFYEVLLTCVLHILELEFEEEKKLLLQNLESASFQEPSITSRSSKQNAGKRGSRNKKRRFTPRSRELIVMQTNSKK